MGTIVPSVGLRCGAPIIVPRLDMVLKSCATWGRTAESLARQGEGGRLTEELRHHSKVGELDGAARSQQHVGRLDVAVNGLLLDVHIVERT